MDRPELSPAQRAALGHVHRVATEARSSAWARITAVLDRAGGVAPPQELLNAALGPGSIALNFHPDRIATDGRTVAQALLEDGVYRNQFETRISAGGLSAFAGGDRDRWEDRLFGGAYQVDGVGAAERPKYGGLNVMGHPDGPCPRFGSCHLVLRRHVAQRSTFCFADSHLGPFDIGTWDTFEPVLAAIVEAAETHHTALGRDGSVAEIANFLLADESRQRSGESGPRMRGPDSPEPPTRPGRALDDYVEAQVHGPVDLADDAMALLADPSFRITAIGALLADIAERYGLDLVWHGGFELEVGDVPPELPRPADARPRRAHRP